MAVRLRDASVGCLLALLLTATPVSAQMPSDPTAGLRLGPVTVRPSVQLANVGVDTNILRERENAKRDEVGTLASMLTGFMRIRPLRLSATSDVGVDYFRRFESQRSINRQHEFRADLPFHRIAVYGSGAFVNARQRFNYEIEERVRRIGRTTLAGTELRLTAKTRMGLEARHSIVDFAADEEIGDTSLRAVLERRADRLQGFVSVSLTPLTTLVIRADTERDRFASSPMRNADSLRIMPGIEFKPGAAIVGHAFLGYRRFDPKNNQFPSFRGLIGSVDTRWSVGSSTRLGLIVDRELEYSYQLTDPMYVLTVVRGSVTQRIGDQWELDVRTGRQRLAYRSTAVLMPLDAATPGTSRTDRGWRNGIGVVYHVSRHLRIRGDAEHLNRRSDVLTGQFAVTRATASIQYDFVR